MPPLPEYSLWLGPGAAAERLAPLLWDALGSRGQGAMLWDIELPRRARTFTAVLRDAPLVGLAWTESGLEGLAWVYPLAPGSRCGVIHFCFARRLRADVIARDFLRRVRRADCYESLLAFLPAVYRHARLFARQMGFEELGSIPGACRMAARNKAVDGALMLLSMHGGPEHG